MPVNGGDEIHSCIIEVVHNVQLEVVALYRREFQSHLTRMGSLLTVLPVMRGPGNAPFTRAALIDVLSAQNCMHTEISTYERVKPSGEMSALPTVSVWLTVAARAFAPKITR